MLKNNHQWRLNHKEQKARTDKEYYENNKEKCSIQGRVRYLKNLEKLNSKIICDSCSSIHTFRNSSRHRKTNYHLQIVNTDNAIKSTQQEYDNLMTEYKKINI
jgi:hypothetical protein